MDWIPLPAVGFAPSAGVFDKERGIIVRQPVCAGELTQVWFISGANFE